MVLALELESNNVSHSGAYVGRREDQLFRIPSAKIHDGICETRLIAWSNENEDVGCIGRQRGGENS